ncbi:Vacuolar transporter chaperone 1 [Yarrowia sp. C11]|nr:Vacuolar transporter chaperone 1 [Yarrowia sp. E02]KAG5372368.1 Vacuolar transporter chaperone 1 [Yarrowia sp. C11]
MLVSDDAKVDEDISPSSLGNGLPKTHIHTKCPQHLCFIEPKVFFANERTFLSWLNFTVILGGLAVGLLNFGDKVGRISAGMFTLVAMATMGYALVTYHWRAAAIRKRGSGPYDDRFGPTMLCIFLLAAVVVNFVLRMAQ